MSRLPSFVWRYGFDLHERLLFQLRKRLDLWKWARTPAWPVVPSDQPILVPDVQIIQDGSSVEVIAPSGLLRLPRTNASKLERILAELDGASTVAAAFERLGSTPRASDLKQLTALVGTALLLPQEQSFSARVPRHEIVRDPRQDGYSIPRIYWSNMIALREALSELEPSTESPERFAGFLAHLHTLAVKGPTEGERYVGRSPGVKIRPGIYRWSRSTSWWRASFLPAAVQIAELLDDPYATDRTQRFFTRNGQLIGYTIFEGRYFHHHLPRGRSAGKLAMAGLIENLRMILRDYFSGEANADEATAYIAEFHQAFVQCCPFPAINNSVAMNVVNYLLKRTRLPAISHFGLDQLALRLQRASYARLFGVLVRELGIFDEDPDASQKEALGGVLWEWLEAEEKPVPLRELGVLEALTS